MFALVVVVAVLVIVEALVWRYGTDTRDGNDWKLPAAVRHSPYIG